MIDQSVTGDFEADQSECRMGQLKGSPGLKHKTEFLLDSSGKKD